jgi:hypothetical protein
MEIEAETLTTFELAPDGSRVRLNGAAADGRPVSLSIPSECLNQLAMTLPRMASEAIRRQYNDRALRMVYPARAWRIEPGAGRGDSFILTLGTPDGFEVSFAIGQDQMSALENDVRDAMRAGMRSPNHVN